MSCKRFRPAIAAHAAGGEIDAAAGRHLGECEACRRTLDTQVQLLAELDAELGRALSIPASPDFAARAARQARDARGASAQRWMPAPVWAGLGVAAAILLSVWIAGAFRLKPEATQTDGVRETATATRPRAEVSGEADTAGLRLPKAPQTTRRKPPVPSETLQARKPPTPGCVASGFSRKTAACEKRTPSTAELPVIVEPSRAQAIQRLRELMTEGRLDQTMLPPPVRAEAVLTELSIAPLEIADIRVRDVEIVGRPPAATQRQ